MKKSMYKKFKSCVKAVAGIAFLLAILASISSIIDSSKGTGKVKTGEVDENLLFKYQSLVTHQLFSEWECLPESGTKREEFVLNIMKRFIPQDWNELESGKIWIQDYRSKQHAETLTVKDREELQFSYDHHSLVPWNQGFESCYLEYPYSINPNTKCVLTLHVSECAVSPSEICSHIQYGFSEDLYLETVSAYYENDYAKWEVSNQIWHNVLERGEYERAIREKTIDEKIKELQEHQRADELLLAQAKEQVFKMSASSVSPSNVDATIKQQYLNLKCHQPEQGKK